MAQAAIHGLGIALLPTFFAEPYLRDGQLILASDRSAKSNGQYYLVWPEARQPSAGLDAFRSWLLGQIEAENVS